MNNDPTKGWAIAGSALASGGRPMGRRPSGGHVNLLGEYDLSAEKFKDSVGIKPPKLTD